MATTSTIRASRVPTVGSSASIVVSPRNINDPTYYVTLEHAEQLVARGKAEWVPGLKRLRELAVLAVRGELREWRPTMCYDPVARVSIKTMQLVPPARAHHYVTRQPKTRTNSKRKPVNRLLYQM
jgi:hypothetical protein